MKALLLMMIGAALTAALLILGPQDAKPFNAKDVAGRFIYVKDRNGICYSVLPGAAEANHSITAVDCKSVGLSSPADH